jgi:hypothetical protein
LLSCSSSLSLLSEVRTVLGDFPSSSLIFLFDLVTGFFFFFCVWLLRKFMQWEGNEVFDM